VIEGEPGIGKTRLAQELAAEAADRRWTVLWGAAFEGGAAPAYWPWLPPLRVLADEAGPGWSSAALAALLDPSAGVAQPSLGADHGPFALVEAVAALLTSRARIRPRVLVLDDIQWADAASLELLGGVVHRLDDAPLLLVCTVRQLELGRRDAVVDTLAAIARRPGTVRLRLAGLRPSATADLVEQAIGRRPDDTTLQALHRRSDGNPFFIEELARLLADGEGPAQVPAGVRDVVRHRIGQLPDATVELLQAAAVIGRQSDLDLLSRASGQPPDACLDGLEPAITHRLLVPAGERPGAFGFTHALVREVLSEDLSPLRRARLHLRIADAMPAVDDTVEIIAEHLWQATPVGGAERAAEALERAARVAVRRLAYAPAEQLLERAVRLRQSTAGIEGGPAAELDALLQLVMVKNSRQGYGAGIEPSLMERAKRLAEQQGRRGDLMALLWIEWAAADLARRVDRSEVMAAELLARASAGGGPDELVVAHTASGIARWHRGDLAVAAHHLDTASRLAASAGAPGSTSRLFQGDAIHLAAPFAAYVHELIGDRTDAESDAAYRAAIELYPGDPFWEMVVSSFAASGAVSCGWPERALLWTNRALAVDPEGVSQFWSASVRAYHGSALCLLGRLDDGLPVLDAAWRTHHQLGLRTNGGTWHACRAQGLAAAGRLEESEASLAEAVDGAQPRRRVRRVHPPGGRGGPAPGPGRPRRRGPPGPGRRARPGRLPRGAGPGRPGPTASRRLAHRPVSTNGRSGAHRCPVTVVHHVFVSSSGEVRPLVGRGRELDALLEASTLAGEWARAASSESSPR
jgi:hypothetical protein